MTRAESEQHTGSTFPPQIIDAETGKLRHLDTVDRLEIWDWMLGYRLAMSRAGTIFIRDSSTAPYRVLNWDMESALLRATFCEFVRDLGERYDPPLASLRAEITATAAKTQYDPVLDYFDHLEWDGVPRLFTEFADRVEWSVKELEDDKAVLDLAVAVIFLGAVERAHQATEIPLVPVLYGAQGIGKSATIKAIATLGDGPLANPPYYGSIVPSAFGYSPAGLRDNFLAKRTGKVITELKEIDGILTESNEALLKSLFDDAGTSWRNPYAHNEEYREYTDVLIGTTNEPDMLTDFTGNRRYIPILVRAVTLDISEGGQGWRLDKHPELVAQLWAEAVHLYKNGETWRDYYTADVRKSIEGVTNLHTRRSAYYDVILDKASEMLASDKCMTGSVSISKLKEICATEYPYLRRIMDQPKFESRLKALAGTHRLAVVRRHHRWGDEPRTGASAGFAPIDTLTYSEEDDFR